MADPTYFTANYQVFEQGDDTGDVGVEPNRLPVKADVLIRYKVNTGDTLTYANGGDLYGLVTSRPRRAKIEDGILKDLQGATGVRLLADVDLSLAGDLWYEFEVVNPTVNGIPVSINPFDFPAETSDTPLNLNTVQPIAGSIPGVEGGVTAAVMNAAIGSAIETLKGDASSTWDTLKEIEDIFNSDEDFANVVTGGSAHYRHARSFTASNGTNDRSAIQATLDEGPGVVVFRKGGSWIVDPTGQASGNALKPQSNTIIVIEEGATVQVKDNALAGYALFCLDGVENVTIMGAGTLLGDSPTHTGSTGANGHLILITNGSSNCQVLGPLLLKQAWGDGIYIGGTAICNNIVVDGVTIEDCRRQGVGPYWVDGCIVRNCRIFDIGLTDIDYALCNAAAIDVEPNAAQVVNHVLIENNDVSNCRGSGITVLGHFGTVTDVIVRGNRVDGCGYDSSVVIAGVPHGLIVKNVADAPQVIDNTVTNSGYSGGTAVANLDVRLSDGAVVRGGFYGSGSGPGIYVDTCTYCTIDGATVHNSTHYGVILNGSDDTLVSGCDLVDNCQDNAAGTAHLHIFNGDRTVVRDNTFRGSLAAAWVILQDATVVDTIVANNIGVGSKPTNMIGDAGTSTRQLGNVRVASGVYESWNVPGVKPFGVPELGVFNVEAYGATGDGTTDDTTAVANARAAAIAAGGVLYFPPGVFRVTSTLDWKVDDLTVQGAGAGNSRILQAGSNIAVAEVAGDNISVSGLAFSYATQQSNAACIGLSFGDNTVGSVFMGHFSDLYFENCTVGMSTNPAVTTVAGVFSSVFENIRILGYATSAIWFDGANNTGAANSTGCQFNNIYVHNNASGVATCTNWPVLFRNWDELVINQLNIEHGATTDDDILRLQNVTSAVISGLHVEGMTMPSATNGKSVVNMNSANVIINGGTCKFNTFQGSASNPVFNLFSSNLVLNRWKDSNNTVTTASRAAVNLQSGTNQTALINLMDLAQTTARVENNASGCSVLFDTTTLSANATLALHNQADQTTNYERLRASWLSNVAMLMTEQGGSGTFRDLRVGVANTHYAAFSISNPKVHLFAASTGTAGALMQASQGGLTGASVAQTGFKFAPTVNQTGTSSYIGVSVEVTETATGSGTKKPFAILVGAVEKFSIDNAGTITLADTANVAAGTTTGTKIGTATSQKLGFWNATPIVQPTTAVAAATFAANTSGIANDTATFDGYTIGQVVKALRNAGLLA